MNAWKCQPIGDLVLPVTTWNPSKDRPDEAFAYIDIGAVDHEVKRIVGPKVVLAREAPSRARQLVKVGDVLVSTVRPNLNAVARVPEYLDGATASTGFCVLRPREDLLDGDYLFHWVKSPGFIGDMVLRATGASYPAVSDRIVLESKLPVPSLGEQRRIAETLDKAERLLIKRRSSLLLLNTLSQSTFLNCFGTPSEGKWPAVKVSDAGRVQLGRQRAPQYQTGRYTRPYLRVANVFEDRLDLTDVLSMDFDDDDFAAYRLQYGDILLNEGQSTELVGRPAMWRGEIEDCCFQNTLVRFQADRNKVIPEYALALFLHYFRTGEFAKISSKTSSIAHLGAGRFASMSFPLPPLALQQEFARRVEAIEKLKAAQRASLAHLEALFASLQHRAFRGEL